jgi:integrase
LAPLVFVRPGELRHAEWSEINFDSAEWRIPAEKMKSGVQHIVPSSRQALDILREIQPLTGHGRYVFPSPRSNKRAMSSNAILLEHVEFSAKVGVFAGVTKICPVQHQFLIREGEP